MTVNSFARALWENTIAWIAIAQNKSRLKQTRQKSGFAGHRGTIVRVCEEHPLFRRKPLGQDCRMGNGADDGSDPRGVDQRQRKHLRKYGCIVRMPNEAK